MNTLLYYFGLISLLPLQVFYFKTKTFYEDETRRSERLKGPVIIISNHRSYFDGMAIVLTFFTKRFHFLATDFYQDRRKLLKLAVRLAGGILIEDGGRNLSYVEACKRVVAKGRPLMIFPEGGYPSTFEPAAFSAGYVMLAARSGARIVPVVNDFNYGLFRRLHLLVGNSIELPCSAGTELEREKLAEINDDISQRFLMLYYQLKRRKAARFSARYELVAPKRGDVIRVPGPAYHHYGVYLSPGEVIQFGHALNRPGEDVVVNAVTMKEFCGTHIPEVRTLKRRERRSVRDADEIEAYARSCLGQGGYSISNNNCRDFVDRVTLKI